MKYVLKKVRRVRVNDIATGECKATISDLQSARFTGNADISYAEGAEGTRLAAFDANKVAGFEATNGAIDLNMLALQVGTEVEDITDVTEISVRAKHTITAEEVTAGKFALDHIARGTAGAELKYIYKADKHDTPEKSLKQVTLGTGHAALLTGEFTYENVTASDVTTPTVTFFTGDLIAGDVVIYDYYPKFTKAQRIKNESGKFAITGEVIVDAWFTDICDNKDVPLQVVLPKGKLSGEYTYEMGGNAATQGITVDALSTPCDDGTLWKLYSYDMTDVTDA